MSTPRMATATKSKESDADIKSKESEVEYQSLIERLQNVERKHKLGDVDELIPNSDDPSQTCWAFEAELNKLEPLLQKHIARLTLDCPSWYYKFLAIQAEAKEYFDTATPSYRLDLYVRSQELYRDLMKMKLKPAGTGPESEERKTIKNMVRVIIAGLEYLYTIGEFGAASTCAQNLHKFVVNSGLVTKDNPAYGTQSVIYYFLGRAHRQRGIDDDYQKAIDYFYQCSEYYFELARRRGNKNEDVIYARTRAMVSLAFGAGFLFYNQSDLARAKGLIAQARLAFLKDNSDICCKLHYYYLELLYASILRAEAGELDWERALEGPEAEKENDAAKDKLDRALKILERCEASLDRKPNYYIHVLYNKALIYLYQGSEHYASARERVAELIERCKDNPRWLANGLIIKSHLERRVGNADLALEDAIRAYNQAGSHLPIKIEALLARAQAQMARHHLTAARADVEKAYQLNNNANKKLEAMALILLCQIALAQQQPQRALEKFTQVKAIIPSIKHGFLLNKYRKLEVLIDGFQTDFVIPGNVDDLDYAMHEKALRCWLLDKALREDSNLSRVAQRLKVSKKTIYQWRDTYGVKA